MDSVGAHSRAPLPNHWSRMPQKHEFVQLEPGEDVASVRDRLTVLRGQHVLLIWPEKGTALNRKLDLVLVQREAMRLAIRLALVTHEPEVIKHGARTQHQHLRDDRRERPRQVETRAFARLHRPLRAPGR